MAQAGAGAEESSPSPTAPRAAPSGYLSSPIRMPGLDLSLNSRRSCCRGAPQLESFSRGRSTPFSFLHLGSSPSLHYCAVRPWAIPSLLALSSPCRVTRRTTWDNPVINGRCLARLQGAPFPCPCPAPWRSASPTRTQGESKSKDPASDSSQPQSPRALQCAPLHVQDRGAAARGQQTPGVRGPTHRRAEQIGGKLLVAYFVL